MSETTIKVPHSTEQHERSSDIPAADSVFAGVYGSFAQAAQDRFQKNKASANRQEAIRNGLIQPDVEPHIEFVQSRFDSTERLEELDRPLSPAHFTDRFIDEATSEAKKVYADRPVAIGARIEKARQTVAGFADRASEMLKSGETDGLTVKSFFDRMEAFKHGLNVGYNDLVKKRDEPIPDEQTRAKYRRIIQDEYTNRSNVEKQESGPFLHVNAQQYLGAEITDRYYISPLLNGKPDEVIKIWADTLADLGVDQKLYYKVAQGLSHRYDTVIAYATTETASEMEQAVQEFAQRCPPELLSETVLPAGLEVAKGIARAPEAVDLNRLLRYRGKDIISYNELACALMELSLQRAAYEFKKQGIEPQAVNPKALSETAKPFFTQYLKLAGIDPSTMRVLDDLPPTQASTVSALWRGRPRQKQPFP